MSEQAAFRGEARARQGPASNGRCEVSGRKRARPGDFARRVAHDRRCLVVRGPADIVGLSDHDRAEIELAADFARRMGAATDAGVPLVEAACAIYPDVFTPEKP